MFLFCSQRVKLGQAWSANPHTADCRFSREVTERRAGIARAKLDREGGNENNIQHLMVLCRE
jgi:hypothetical protein